MKTVRENVLIVAVVALAAIVAMNTSNKQPSPKPALTITQRLKAWIFGIPVTSDMAVDEETEEDDSDDDSGNVIESAEYVVHNEPPERELDEQGQPKIKHGFGW